MLLRSTRELSKALQTYYAAPTLPLPDDLIGVIEAYLDKHAESEQSTFDRLHDDLLATFSRSVQFQPPFHYAAFLVILRRLRPAIRTTPHVLLWWEKVAEPALDHMSEERSPSSKVLSDIGRFLFPDDDDDDTEEGSGAQDLNKDGVPYAVGLRLVQKWNHIYESAAACGYGAGWTREKPVQDVLVQFGKKRPKVCAQDERALGGSMEDVLANLLTGVLPYLERLFRAAKLPHECNQPPVRVHSQPATTPAPHHQVALV